MARIPNSFVFANGKGGAGKTHLAANLAAITARRGAGVLLLDFDPQANLTKDLGITEFDQGRSLTGAVMGFIDQPTVYATGRDRMRIIAGGRELQKLQVAAVMEHNGNPRGVADQLQRALAPVLGPNDWLFIDTPPTTGGMLADAALLVAEHLVIPTREDARSLDGVGLVLERVLALAQDGDMINPVGVVEFAFNTSAKQVNSRARQWLEENLHGVMPILSSSIRAATKAQADARQLGLVAGEYAEMAAATPIMPWYEARQLGIEQPSFAKNAPDLAGDYEALLREIGERIGIKV